MRSPRSALKPAPITKRRVPMTLRITEELRDEIRERAEQRGRSMMAEAEIMLEREMALEQAMGGPGLRRLLRAVLGAFVFSGDLGARMQRHPEWEVEQWISDPDCYSLAAMAVTRLLWNKRFHPAPTPEAREKWLDRLTEEFTRDAAFDESGETLPEGLA